MNKEPIEPDDSKGNRSIKCGHHFLPLTDLNPRTLDTIFNSTETLTIAQQNKKPQSLSTLAAAQPNHPHHSNSLNLSHH